MWREDGTVTAQLTKGWRTNDAVSGGGNGVAGGNGTGRHHIREFTLSAVADDVIGKVADCNIICIGPVVVGNGSNTPPYYCAVCSCDDAGFFSLVCGGVDLEDAQRVRALVRDQLRGLGKVVLSFGSELKMAREVERLWPSQRTIEIRELVESGR
jgi:hypothetical protein